MATTARVPFWHSPWFVAIAALALMTVLGLSLSFSTGALGGTSGSVAPQSNAPVVITPTSTPTPTPTATPQPTPTVAPTPKPRITPAPTPIPEELADGGLGLLLFNGGPGKHVAYGLGSMFTPPGKFPEFKFPLLVTRELFSQPFATLAEALQASKEGPGSEVIATIPNPNIHEIGEKWQSDPIQDPVWSEHLLRVELEKLEVQHEYIVGFSLSPNGGESWYLHTEAKFLLFPN